MKKNKWKYIAIFFLAAAVAFITVPFAVGANSIMVLDVESAEDMNNYKITVKRAKPASLGFLTIDPDYLDQENTGYNFGLRIGLFSETNGIFGQEVTNDRSPITGYSVAVGRAQFPSEPLYFGIMDGNKDPTKWANWHSVHKLSANQLPEQGVFYWFSADFSDNPISGNYCFIVFFSEQPYVYPPNDMWLLPVVEDNPYSRGRLLNWDWNNDMWFDWGAGPAHHGIDCNFRTYTTESGGGGEHPSIVINVTGWSVVSYVSGFSSFLFAMVSASKYRGIL